MKLKESYVGSIAIIAIGCLYFALDIYGTKLEYILFGTITGPGISLAAIAYILAKRRRLYVATPTTFNVGIEAISILLSVFLLVEYSAGYLMFFTEQPPTSIIWIGSIAAYIFMAFGSRANDVITYKKSNENNKVTIKEVDKSIEKPVLNINSKPQMNDNKSKNFFIKLKDGDYGLAKTYWLYGVVVNVIFKVLGAYAGSYSQKLFATVLIVNIIYSLLWLVGLHNSATKYEGSKIWVILTYVMILVWLLNTLMLFVGVKSTLGYMD